MTETKLCNEELLTRYHYRDLPDEELLLLEKHLEQCAACSLALEQIEASLSALPIVELKITAGEKLQFTEQVLKRTRSSRNWRKPVWGSILAATGALVLALVVLPTEQKPVAVVSPAMADIEVLEQLELLQDFDILQDLELLEALEDLG